MPANVQRASHASPGWPGRRWKRADEVLVDLLPASIQPGPPFIAKENETMTSAGTDTPKIVQGMERPTPVVRTTSMAFVRFARREMDAMARFLTDFGFVAREHPGDMRYFRGHGAAPWLVSVEPGEADGFIGFGM